MIIIFYILSFFADAKDFSEVKKEIIKEKQLKKQIEIIAENQELFLQANDLMESEVFLLDVMRVIPEDETISNDLKFEIYHLLANIYKEKKEYELAIEFNLKAFKFAEKSELPQNKAKSYILFGDLYFITEEYEKAVEYDLLGIKFCEQRQEDDLKSRFYLKLGKVYYAIEKFDDAEEYLLNALNMTLGKQDFDFVAEIKLYLGKVYLAMKEIEKSERNLISNAVKFTPEGGIIYIASEDHGDKLKLKIRDTGVGIPEDKIPQLFSISSNYTTLGTQKEKGTGLGLVLCKEFIDINKGSIEVNSELGKETTFTITLNKFVA